MKVALLSALPLASAIRTTVTNAERENNENNAEGNESSAAAAFKQPVSKAAQAFVQLQSHLDSLAYQEAEERDSLEADCSESLASQKTVLMTKQNELDGTTEQTKKVFLQVLFDQEQAYMQELENTCSQKKELLEQRSRARQHEYNTIRDVANTLTSAEDYSFLQMGEDPRHASTGMIAKVKKASSASSSKPAAAAVSSTHLAIPATAHMVATRGKIRQQKAQIKVKEIRANTVAHRKFLEDQAIELKTKQIKAAAFVSKKIVSTKPFKLGRVDPKAKKAPARDCSHGCGYGAALALLEVEHEDMDDSVQSKVLVVMQALRNRAPRSDVTQLLTGALNMVKGSYKDDRQFAKNCTGRIESTVQTLTLAQQAVDSSEVELSKHEETVDSLATEQAALSTAVVPDIKKGMKLVQSKHDSALKVFENTRVNLQSRHDAIEHSMSQVSTTYKNLQVDAMLSIAGMFNDFSETAPYSGSDDGKKNAMHLLQQAQDDSSTKLISLKRNQRAAAARYNIDMKSANRKLERKQKRLNALASQLQTARQNVDSTRQALVEQTSHLTASQQEVEQAHSECDHSLLNDYENGLDKREDDVDVIRTALAIL